MHQLDSAVQLEHNDGRFSGQTSAAYSNMVGPFGGITAAQLLNALLLHPERQGEPLALTVNFVAPVKDGAFEIAPQLIRTNRSNQHWFVTQTQNDVVVTTATAIFATRRETWPTTDFDVPEFPATVETVPYFPMLPKWMQNYTFEMEGGGSGMFDPKSETSYTLKSIQDAPPRPLDFLSLTAMGDTFFPRIMIRKAEFVPSGTVTLSMHFHVDAATLAAHGDAAVIGQARANRFNRSYFDQTSEVWTPAGELLLTSMQSVYYKV